MRRNRVGELGSRFLLITAGVLTPYILLEAVFMAKRFGGLSRGESALVHDEFEVLEVSRVLLMDSGGEGTLFRTGRGGAIVPNDYESAHVGGYGLVCGGSTSEGYLANEKERMWATAERVSGLELVNLSKSGKTLRECIKTIQRLEKGETPEILIVATSVNNLMDYGKSKRRDSMWRWISRNSLARRIGSSMNKFRDGREVGEFTEYEKALIDGCCHGIAGINKETGRDTVRWESKEELRRYKAWSTMNLRELIKAAKEKDIDKGKIGIVIEAHSYGLGGGVMPGMVNGGYDLRQRLHAANGREMSVKESGLATDRFDAAYREAAEELGISVMQINGRRVGERGFYDAVHMTSEGSRRAGEEAGAFIEELRMNNQR